MKAKHHGEEEEEKDDKGLLCIDTLEDCHRDINDFKLSKPVRV